MNKLSFLIRLYQALNVTYVTFQSFINNHLYILIMNFDAAAVSEPNKFI